MKFKFVPVSANSKTGPIPVVWASRNTCPIACPLKKNGCYSENFPMGRIWDKVDETGVSLEAVCEKIKDIPKGSLWRYGVAGDLPGDGVTIDSAALAALAKASKGRRGFAYTHYDIRLPDNWLAIDRAAQSITINLSANSIEHAQQLRRQSPSSLIVAIAPKDYAKRPWRDEIGTIFTVCPAYTSKLTCATCGICHNRGPRVVVVFPAHGTRHRAVDAVIKFHRS